MRRDPFARLKQHQREMWASCGPTALFTTPVASRLQPGRPSTRLGACLRS